MKIVQIPNGAFVENTYLVIDEAAAQCAVIDPGEEADRILHEIAGAGARPTAIWITHAHLDHVMGVARVRRETAAPVYLHPADRELYDRAVQQGFAFGVAVERPPSRFGVSCEAASPYRLRRNASLNERWAPAVQVASWMRQARTRQSSASNASARR